MKTFLFFLMGLVTVLVLILAGASTYWVIQPDYSCIKGGPAETIDRDGRPKTKFKATEWLYTKREIERVCEIHYLKVWYVIMNKDTGEIIVNRELAPAPLDLGISRRISRYDIPDDASPGRYTLNRYITYRLNPLRQGFYRYLPEIEFEIVE